MPRPMRAYAGFSGTVTLPMTPVRADARAESYLHASKTPFAKHVTPLDIKANRQACTDIACLDNKPGSAPSDERLANLRPACCQAALDVDEPLYALSEIFSASEHDASHAHHAHMSGCAAGRWMALGTGVAACVAILYGRRNYVASKQAGTVLARIRGRVEARLPAARPDATKPLPMRQAWRNDRARIRSLKRAEATHRFSVWHGGAFQMTNGALLLMSIAWPALAPAATLGMAVFCGLQAWRFAAQRARLTNPMPQDVAAHDTLALVGWRVFEQRRAASRKAFRLGALAHGVYGAGAACLTLAASAAGCSFLLWPGLLCLTVGMVAVAVTNKSCADHTFTSNRDADLGTETLGRKASMLRQLALLAREGGIAYDSAAQVPSTDTRWQRGVRGLLVFLATCCGREEQAQGWAHRRRVGHLHIEDTNWLATCIVEVGKIRKAALQEEVAALTAKQQRPKHRQDADALKNTIGLLSQWVRLENDWAHTCTHSAPDAHAMADMTLSWLMSRRWHEEMVSGLYLCCEDRDRQQPWWATIGNAEPQFKAQVWLEALAQHNDSAQRTWGIMQAAIADYLVRRQGEVTRERIDAMINHLGDRLSG